MKKIEKNKFVLTVAQLASIGTPYAFNICTIYGRIANNPVNSLNRNMLITSKNGFNVRFRVNSFNLTSNVGGGCGHFTFCFVHKLHEFDRSL